MNQMKKALDALQKEKATMQSEIDAMKKRLDTVEANALSEFA